MDVITDTRLTLFDEDHYPVKVKQTKAIENASREGIFTYYFYQVYGITILIIQQGVSLTVNLIYDVGTYDYDVFIANTHKEHISNLSMELLEGTIEEIVGLRVGIPTK